MKKTIQSFISKVSYAFAANIIGTIVTIVVTFILPKFFGDKVEQYGYYQIYLFYIGYIGFLHFGWCDGIYLRDGGKLYSEINKDSYAAQFRLLTYCEFIIAAVIGVSISIISRDRNMTFIGWMICLNIVMLIPQSMLTYVLQATNRIKEYSIVTVSGRVAYIAGVIGVVIYGLQNYRYIIAVETLTKIIPLVLSCVWCKDIVKRKKITALSAFDEAKKNIGVGSNLMFANIAGLLITGIVRWGIQQQWDVATYGRVSFTLSISNLLMTLIVAIGIVLYPALRRVEQIRLLSMYARIRECLMVPLLGMLILFYPIQQIVSAWLPQYADSLKYMAILIPTCIYSAKMSMLIQTYMKVFRYEKLIMKVNIAGVFVSLMTTFITVFVQKNLTLAMLSIVINQMFRCIYAEIVLSKKTGISVLKNICTEAALTTVFIVANWYVGGWYGVCIYATFYVAYLIVNRKEISTLVIQMKALIQGQN